MEFVSWDDDIPNIWKVLESHRSHVPNQQPDINGDPLLGASKVDLIPEGHAPKRS